MFKRIGAIFLSLLLVSSLFTGYFTVRLIDNVVVKNKLSTTEQYQSGEISDALNLSSQQQFKKVDPEFALNLGYASPFLVEHEAQQFKWVADVHEVAETTSVQLLPLSQAENHAVANIIGSIFQQFVPVQQELAQDGNVSTSTNEIPPYLASFRQIMLAVAVPPPLV